MKVTGYWPLEGTTGISFLKRLTQSASAAMERSMRQAFSTYIDVDSAAIAGTSRVEIEPENFQALAEFEGGPTQAKISLGIWEENGRYWMRHPTYDEAIQAFISASVLFCAYGGPIEGEIYNDCHAAIAACADKLTDSQRASLTPIALLAISALERLNELSADMPPTDQALMGGTLKSFRLQLSG